MRRSKLIILVLALTAMSSCLVSSLHPFFKQKDKIFDPAMVGAWIDGDSCIWTIEPDITKELIWVRKNLTASIMSLIQNHLLEKIKWIVHTI